MPVKIRQKLVILFSAVLAVLLYFAPKAIPEHTGDKNSVASASLEEIQKQVPAGQREIFDRLEKALHKAEAENSEQSWIGCSDDLLKSARYIQGSPKATLYQYAIDGYEKALQLNPGNLHVKTSLGTAIVESASLLGIQPMKGISLLREVVQQDSANIEANLQLGLFSVTSQQFDKAIERFKKILRIDSTRTDMYVYLGDTYIQMGDRKRAIENYEKYKSKVTDTLIVKDIDQYIKKLKTQP